MSKRGLENDLGGHIQLNGIGISRVRIPIPEWIKEYHRSEFLDLLNIVVLFDILENFAHGTAAATPIHNSNPRFADETSLPDAVLEIGSIGRRERHHGF